MSLQMYAHDKVFTIALNLICMTALSFFLFSVGNGFGIIQIILITWSVIYLIQFIVGFYKLKAYFNEISSILGSLDKKYLLLECMPNPKSNTEKICYSYLKQMSKSMIENVSEANNRTTEYKEYIEQWIHEIKIPITTIQLICENNKSHVTNKIKNHLEQIWIYVEMSLYYARSGFVEKDFVIKETSIQDVINEVLFRNKQLLMHNDFNIELINVNTVLFTDSKWLIFIINQLIQNSIKYKSNIPKLTIQMQEDNDEFILSIMDNGMGISKNELGRVFEKGFTGSNGRNERKSTGIGLYLCKKLCLKIGIQMNAESQMNEYTRINLIFPKSVIVKPKLSRL